MNAIKLIASHLSAANLKKLAKEQVNTICSFTGESLTEGYPNSQLIKDTFTDHAYIRYPSGYSSESIALVLSEVLPNSKGNGYNSLRSYSYYCNDTELKLLSREQILSLLLNLPDVPFVLCVSYNNKKHTAYKAVLNLNTERFTITTDLYNVEFCRSVVMEFLPVIIDWYQVIPGKEQSSQQPTFFTKEEIRTGQVPYQKQKSYGLELFEEQNEFLEQFRHTHIFELIIHLLNKKTS